jgi:hypothetical protein
MNYGRERSCIELQSMIKGRLNIKSPLVAFCQAIKKLKSFSSDQKISDINHLVDVLLSKFNQ